MALVQFWPAKISIRFESIDDATSFARGFIKAKAYDFELYSKDITPFFRGVRFWIPFLHFCRKWGIREDQSVTVVSDDQTYKENIRRIYKGA